MKFLIILSLSSFFNLKKFCGCAPRYVGSWLSEQGLGLGPLLFKKFLNLFLAA